MLKIFKNILRVSASNNLKSWIKFPFTQANCRHKYAFLSSYPGQQRNKKHKKLPNNKLKGVKNKVVHVLRYRRCITDEHKPRKTYYLLDFVQNLKWKLSNFPEPQYVFGHFSTSSSYIKSFLWKKKFSQLHGLLNSFKAPRSTIF